MTRKHGTLLIIILCMILNISASASGSDSDINFNAKIRVGLKQYNERASFITVDNATLIMGYDMNGEWLQETTFKSSNGFKFVPAFNYLLISEQYFYTYDEAIIKVNMLREQGYNAYAGSASQGIWKIYVGNVATEVEAEDIRNTINTLYDLTYEVSGDNGYRTFMEYSAGYPVVFENTYQHPTFSTNDLVDGIAVIDLGSRSYRGKIEIGRYGNVGVTAINIVGLNEYLYGVVPSEMPKSFPLEALKAQAVAARNYAIYYTYVNLKYPNQPYDVCDTVSSQVYKGFGVEADICTQAVNETTDKLVYYGDTIIPAYFFSSSGGHTEDSQNVWSGTVPYLTGKSDLYETDPERDPWLTVLTPSDIQKALSKYSVNIGNITDVQVLDYSDTGRAMTLRIIGTSGQYDLVKETMRYWLGLNSRKFTLVKSGDTPNKTFYTVSSTGETKSINYNSTYSINDDLNTSPVNSGREQLIVMSGENICNYSMVSGQKGQFIFVGQGWGHGVGMSQCGSKGMAENGYTFEEILEYYYTGTEVR